MPASKANIICACAFTSLLGKGAFLSTLKFLRKDAADILVCDDICRISVEEKSKLQDFCAGKEVGVFACKQRAAKALFESVGLNENLKFFDIKNDSEKIAADLGFEILSESELSLDDLPKPRGTWEPWFPIVDRERCVDCGKCVDFCVFKVYEKNGGKVEVKSPSNCKNNCPACARMCPKGAIIFPKCPDDAISGGGGVAAHSKGNAGFLDALKRRREAVLSAMKKDGENK